jgi:putative RNA 2'-phosphotransferase
MPEDVEVDVILVMHHHEGHVAGARRAKRVVINPIEYGIAADLERAGFRIDDAVLKALVELDDKGRFELQNGKIRARYGHSIDVSISYPEDATSATLYHGTSQDFLPAILREGILPMKRRYVHLAVDVETACLNAARRPRPVVLAVDAQCLRRRGYRVYVASHKIRLVQYVPPECIEKKVTC